LIKHGEPGPHGIEVRHMTEVTYGHPEDSGSLEAAQGCYGLEALAGVGVRPFLNETRYKQATDCRKCRRADNHHFPGKAAQRVNQVRGGRPDSDGAYDHAQSNASLRQKPG